MRYKSLALRFLAVAFNIRNILTQTTADVTQIYTDKLSTASGYNNNVRPGVDQSVALDVNVTFNLVAIQNFDEIAETLSTVGFLLVTWRDERVTWSPASYAGVQSILASPSDVWVPELTLANPFDTIKAIGTNLSKVRFLFNGVAVWSPGDILKSTCTVDVTYYPFDIQTCDLLLYPWSYTSREINISSVESTFQLDHYSENGVWILSETSAASHESQSGFAFVKLSLKLQRRPTFVIINVISPIIFMSFLNILVFILPHESGERVGYAVTVLLSIAVFLTLVGDHMPKSSKPMSHISYYLMTILIMSALICMCNILILRLYHKPEGKEVPAWLCKVVCSGRRKITPARAKDEKKPKRLPDDSEDDTGSRESVTWVKLGKLADFICGIFWLFYVIVCTTGFLVVIATVTDI